MKIGKDSLMVPIMLGGSQQGLLKSSVHRNDSIQPVNVTKSVQQKGRDSIMPIEVDLRNSS